NKFQSLAEVIFLSFTKKRWIQIKMILYLQVDCSEYKRLERGRPIYCERLYQPFCGSDGKTYNNKCSFCKLYTAISQSLNFIHLACSDDGEQGTE
uniref:Ovomucoid n=1 Tax=Accipiter nisus TaxID=211598 RepID=A0A8B9RUH1_9AVES